MIPPRALTLIEVVAATVLLAVLAAGAAPLMREARVSLRACAAGAGARTELGDLGRFADAALADPKAHGLWPLLVHGAGDAAVDLAWPESPGRSPVHVGRIGAPGAVSAHAWLVFRSGDSAVCRWIPLGRGPAKGPER